MERKLGGKSLKGKSVRKSKATSKAGSKSVLKKKTRTLSRKQSKIAPLRGREPRIMPGDIGRTSHQHRFSRSFLYYAMGAVALAVGAVYLVYQETLADKAIYAAHDMTTPAPKKPVTQVAINGPFAEEFKQAQMVGFQDKIGFWSSYIERNLEGRKKLLTLTMGQKIDDIAPIIPEKYNCTTFVETVSALARSQTPDDVVKNILAIRYRGGQPSFENRNHFPESDWIPNNQEARILKDITGEIASSAGVTAQVEMKEIDRGKWLSEQVKHNRLSRSLASVVSKDWSTPVDAKVTYIEIGKMNAVLEKIPSGTVLNLVHKNDGVHPVLITHQGFVIREGSHVLLRHASTGGRIRTNDLHSYLQNLVRQQRPHSKWPLIGIHLDQINDSASANNFLRESM